MRKSKKGRTSKLFTCNIQEIIQNFGDRSLLPVHGSFNLRNTLPLNLVRNDLGLNSNPFDNHLGRCQPRRPRQLAGLRPKKSVNLQTVLLNQSAPHKFSTNCESSSDSRCRVSLPRSETNQQSTVHHGGEKPRQIGDNKWHELSSSNSRRFGAGHSHS